MSKKPHFPRVPSFPFSIPTKAKSPDILDIPGNLIPGLGAGEVDADGGAHFISQADSQCFRGQNVEG